MPTSADPPQGPRIRREPTGPIPTSARTQIIRRSPSTDDASTALIAPPGDTATTLIAPPGDSTAARTAIGTAVVGILSGWATAAVSTDLISGRWPADRVFCLAIGFLSLLFAATSVPGVVLVLMRRWVGRYLIAFSCSVALLTFGALFLADTAVAWPVYLIPVLPLVTLVLAFRPATRRWCDAGG